VKSILAHACSSLLQAVRMEEVSINLADKWCLEPETQQQKYLRLMRIERGIKRKATNIVAAHLARVSSSKKNRPAITFSELVGLLNNTRSVEVEIVDAPGRTIFVTKDLIDSPPRQEELVG
jgi:hypothetical protein